MQFFLIALFSLSGCTLLAQDPMENSKILKQKTGPSLVFVQVADEVVVRDRSMQMRTIKRNPALSAGAFKTKLAEVQGQEGQVLKVYYRGGLKNAANRFIATGRLLISFGKTSGVNYQKFAEIHQLQFIKEVNRLYKTAVFQPLQEFDLIDLTNQLNQLPEVRNASPDWISPRRLQ